MASSSWGDCPLNHRYYNLWLNVSHDSNHSCIPLGTACLTFVSCSFSVIGCIAIFALFVFGKPRTLSRWILLFIAVSDLLTAVGYMFGSTVFMAMFLNEDHTITPPVSCFDSSTNDSKVRTFCKLCIAQSFVTTASSMFSFFWTSILAFHLFLTAALNRNMLSKRLMPAYHVVSWSVGLIITGAVCGVQLLGPGGSEDSVAWCFIEKMGSTRHSVTLALEFLAGKFWEILAYILTAVFYTLLVVALCKRRKDEVFKQYVNLEWKLALVPILFILVRMWGTIRFLMALATLNNSTMNLHNHPFLVNMQAIGDGAQGWINGVLFVLLNAKALQLYNRICCLFRIRKQNNNDRLHFGGNRRIQDSPRNDCIGEETTRLIHPSSRHANLYYGSSESEVTKLGSFKGKRMTLSSDAMSTPVPSDNELLQ